MGKYFSDHPLWIGSHCLCWLGFSLELQRWILYTSNKRNYWKRFSKWPPSAQTKVWTFAENWLQRSASFPTARNLSIWTLQCPFICWGLSGRLGPSNNFKKKIYIQVQVRALGWPFNASSNEPSKCSKLRYRFERCIIARIIHHQNYVDMHHSKWTCRYWSTISGPC